MHKCFNLVCNVIFIPEFLWYRVVVGKFDVTTEAQTDDDIVSEVKKDRAEEDTEEENEEGGEECS
jgi:hypothetical protein